MKCVKTGDEVIRLSDEKAAERVKKGAKYVSKKEWKGTADKKMIAVEQPIASDRPKNKKQKKMKSDDSSLDPVGKMINKKQ